MLMRVGRIFLGLSSLGLGGVLVWKATTVPWEPLLTWPPKTALFFCVMAALLFAGGLGALTKRFAFAVLGLGLGWFLLGLPAAMMIKKPGDFLSLYGVVEATTFACGGWAVLGASGAQGPLASLAAQQGTQRLAQAICGATFIFYGASHFMLLKYTASLIPAIFPAHVALAAFTGAAHIAAGIALITGVLPRLAVTLQAIMLTSFGLIVQIPTLIEKPAVRSQWIEVLASFAMAGAAWAIAAQLEGKALWPFGRRALAPA
jgi:uncharacterized membrane protein